MPDSGFVPLFDVLEPWLDRPLSDMPEALRSRAERELSPNAWNLLAPVQRRTVVRQLDYFANPATEAERTRGYELDGEISEATKRLGELRDTEPTSVSEIAIKRQLMVELGQELDRLVRERSGPRKVDQTGTAGSEAESRLALNFGVDEVQKMTIEAGGLSGRDRVSRTKYELWLDKSRFEGWFSRRHHRAFAEDLIEFVCCYPDGDNGAVEDNREHIQDVITHVFVSQDVACNDADVPQPVLEQFRLKFDAAVKTLKKPLPKDECALNLKVWDSGFPGKWRPEPTPAGDQPFFEVFGYQCWISAQGKLRWEQPRFMPGTDYDGTFRGSEYVTRCRLELVRAIAEYRHEETGRMLNPELFAALADLSERDNPANVAKPLGNSEKGVQEMSAPVVNRIRTRDDLLRPAIRLAQLTALEPSNYLSVWAELLKLAKSATPPTPVVGHNAEDAICWNDADGVTKSFKKNALRARFDRAAGKYKRGRKQAK